MHNQINYFGVIILTCLTIVSCSSNKEMKTKSQVGISHSTYSALKVETKSLTKTLKPISLKEPFKLNDKVIQFEEHKLAGEKVIVRDVRNSYESAVAASTFQGVSFSRDPNDFPKTSIRPENFDIDMLLKYSGTSSEQKAIKNGRGFVISVANESNYRKIDILLSALGIPFVIHVSGGELGGGFSSTGELYVIVSRQNYREAVKLIYTAIKNGEFTQPSSGNTK